MSLAEISQRSAVLDLTCFSFSPFPVLLAGNIPQLGNWDPQHALQLEFTGSLRGREKWQGSIQLEPGQRIEFKFIHVGADGFDWEIGANRTHIAQTGTGLIEAYFRAGSDTWQRLLAGDRVTGGGNLTGRGDIVRALEIIAFLANSTDGGVRSATLKTISSKAADTICFAAADDGHDAERDLTSIIAMSMVNGRSPREVVVAHLPTSEHDHGSIDYVVEGGVVVGRLYRNSFE